MQLFEATKKRLENLENLYRSLLTIRPTFVEAERGFSEVGFLLPRLETG